MPDSIIPGKVKPELNKVKKAVITTGEKNSYGFDQYIIDK